MTLVELVISPGFALIVVVSAAGACLACPNWGSRLWFFIVAPAVYAILWFVIASAMMLPLMLIEALAGLTASPELHGLLTTGATMALYGLNCIMLRRDGARGASMKGSVRRRGVFVSPASNDLPSTASRMTLSWDNSRRPGGLM